MVVENSDTFDSLRRALSEAPGRVGTLAWSAGAGFESSVLSEQKAAERRSLFTAALLQPGAASRLKR